MNNNPNEAEENRRSDVQGADTATEKRHYSIEVIAAKAAADNGQAATPEAAEMLRTIEACRIKAEDPIKDEVFMFEWCGVSFMPKENLTSLKAPAKTGKTFALTLFALAFLKGDYMGLKCNAKGERMLFVDTEQSRNDSRKILERIIREGGDPNRIDVLNLRTIENDKRLLLIELYASMNNPSLIIVDGIADLLPGMKYNDMDESDKRLTRLSKLAEDNNAVIITAIHVNRNNNDSDEKTATGWLGKLLEQKCSGEIEVARASKTSPQRTIKATKTRHKEFQPITFEIIDTPDHIGEVKIVTKEDAEREAQAISKAAYVRKLKELGFDKPFVKNRDTFTEEFREKTLAKMRREGNDKDYTKKNAQASILNYIKSGALRVDPNNGNIIFDAE